jgi:hypothetical protein
MERPSIPKGVVATFFAVTMIVGTVGLARAEEDHQGKEHESVRGRWMAGDFHTHTYLTDGGRTQEEVALHAFSYGLDWFANSEHGGFFARDPHGTPLATPVPRWITIKDSSFPIVQGLRAAFPQKRILQGAEWNVPTHEHASVGIVTNEPTAVSDFEYVCDKSDTDIRGGIPKTNTTHADAVACAAMLERNFPETSYFLPNHPSRQQKYTVADFRDFNNTAPHVAFGFEGIPGHQKETARGGYGNFAQTDPVHLRARTYGGADFMVAKVGGLWDALLGEGRRFFAFVNSDFHDTPGDFWPGEYAKSYTFVKGNDLKSIVDGMRSGNTFAVHGDLIDGLRFRAESRGQRATMGETLHVGKNGKAEITVAFHSPKKNNHGDVPRVDHIDLIAGNVSGKALPGTPAYAVETNPTTRVVKRFTERDWTCEEGWCKAKFELKHLNEGMYFRLRGTNLPPGTLTETDGDGNPQIDDMVCGAGQAAPNCNDPDKTYADLWFYSNPIFVEVGK